MLAEDALPQRLLILLAATTDSIALAAAIGSDLRTLDIPTLLLAPPGSGAAQLLPEGLDAQPRWWRERAWVRRLRPDGVLALDDSSFCCQGLLAARSQGVSTLLALPVGQRLPWSMRFARIRVAPLAATPDAPAARAGLVAFLRAELLGTSAGVARLALSPLALAGGVALSVKRS